MFYLIETSKEGRIRKLRKGSKCAMEIDMTSMADRRTMAIHKFKNDTEVMAFINAHNNPLPLTRFTSVPSAEHSKPAQTKILTRVQAEKAYNAMCALNNVGGRIDIRLAPGVILVSETEAGNVLINSWELGDESHSDRQAFATAYGLQ